MAIRGLLSTVSVCVNYLVWNVRTWFPKRKSHLICFMEATSSCLMPEKGYVKGYSEGRGVLRWIIYVKDMFVHCSFLGYLMSEYLRSLAREINFLKKHKKRFWRCLN